MVQNSNDNSSNDFPGTYRYLPEFNTHYINRFTTRLMQIWKDENKNEVLYSSQDIRNSYDKNIDPSGALKWTKSKALWDLELQEYVGSGNEYTISYDDNGTQYFLSLQPSQIDNDDNYPESGPRAKITTCQPSANDNTCKWIIENCTEGRCRRLSYRIKPSQPEFYDKYLVSDNRQSNGDPVSVGTGPNNPAEIFVRNLLGRDIEHFNEYWILLRNKQKSENNYFTFINSWHRGEGPVSIGGGYTGDDTGEDWDQNTLHAEQPSTIIGKYSTTEDYNDDVYSSTIWKVELICDTSYEILKRANDGTQSRIIKYYKKNSKFYNYHDGSEISSDQYLKYQQPETNNNYIRFIHWDNDDFFVEDQLSQNTTKADNIGFPIILLEQPENITYYRTNQPEDSSLFNFVINSQQVGVIKASPSGNDFTLENEPDNTIFYLPVEVGQPPNRIIRLFDTYYDYEVGIPIYPLLFKQPSASFNYLCLPSDNGDNYYRSNNNTLLVNNTDYKIYKNDTVNEYIEFLQPTETPNSVTFNIITGDLVENTVLSVRPGNNNFTGKFKAITEYDINYIYKTVDGDEFKYITDTGNNSFVTLIKNENKINETFIIYDSVSKGNQKPLCQAYGYDTKNLQPNIVTYCFENNNNSSVDNGSVDIKTAEIVDGNIQKYKGEYNDDIQLHSESTDNAWISFGGDGPYFEKYSGDNIDDILFLDGKIKVNGNWYKTDSTESTYLYQPSNQPGI